MKKPKIALIVLAIFVGGAFLLLALWNLNRKEPEPPITKPAATPPTKQPEVNYGLPARLKIPKLKVDAAIDQMGVTPQGDMQDPSNPRNAGWYKFGPRPGNKGSAVIAGHYGVEDKDIAIFNKLHTLSKGDLIHVEDDKGATTTFVIREFQIYNKDETVPKVFGSNDEKAHLNLITCQGTWNKAQQTYSERLVVFADKSEVSEA